MTILLGVNPKNAINPEDLPESPFMLFDEWFTLAGEKEPSYPNAMSLATAPKNGRPSARTVLLKGHDERGFVFYTNSESHKGQDLADNPQAEILFHWKSIERQIRISGPVNIISTEEADAYFASRPRDAQIGAWASQQSQEMQNRDSFMKAFEEIDQKYKDQDVPRPPHWNGYRLAPDHFEFWIEVEFRLHHRFAYEKDDAGWTRKMLYP